MDHGRSKLESMKEGDKTLRPQVKSQIPRDMQTSRTINSFSSHFGARRDIEPLACLWGSDLEEPLVPQVLFGLANQMDPSLVLASQSTKASADDALLRWGRMRSIKILLSATTIATPRPWGMRRAAGAPFASVMIVVDGRLVLRKPTRLPSKVAPCTKGTALAWST